MERPNSYYFSKILKSTEINESGCWVWKKAKTMTGYGATCYHGKQISTHILVMKLIGLHREGLVVDHVCMNKACCNPKHLRMVTHSENILQNSRHVAGDHCRKGHPYTEENTRVGIDHRTGKPRRRCKTCQREKNREIRGVSPERFTVD